MQEVESNNKTNLISFIELFSITFEEQRGFGILRSRGKSGAGEVPGSHIRGHLIQPPLVFPGC